MRSKPPSDMPPRQSGAPQSSDLPPSMADYSAFTATPSMQPRFYAQRLPSLYKRLSPTRRPRPHRLRHEPLTVLPCATATNPSDHAAAPPPPPLQPSLRLAPAMRRPDPLHAAPFSDFFVEYFREHNPAIATLLRPQQVALAAAVYLFRFDRGLCSEYVETTLQSMARRVADASGKSVAESRRVFAAAAKAASQVYFANSWDEVSSFVAANTPVLLDLQKRSRKLMELTEALQTSPTTVRDVDPPLLQALLDMKSPVLVLVFADYCSVCKTVSPLFDDAARISDGVTRFVRLNGPKSPQFKLYYKVPSYPTLLLFRDHDDVVPFPKGQAITPESIAAFANGGSAQTVLPAQFVDLSISEDLGSPENSLTDFGSEMESATAPNQTLEWASILIRQGIDELDALASEREEMLHSKIDQPLHCEGPNCDVLPLRTHDEAKGDPPPLCVLLGGGMGAGKTTAVSLVAETPFWKKFGEGVVIVEADAFKLNDPLFHVLPNRIVHHDSIIAAEDLFLQAVNNRRDVVFDGTLSWCEYARQTIEMVRDTEYFYERGPGYCKNVAGDVSEIYWVRAKKRSEAVAPYNIELVGVTADAEVSVMRGIVRKITSGRGVPIPDQLHSHVLFSKNFEEYIELVDAVYLFDTTVNSSTIEERSRYEEQLVAIKKGILFKPPAFPDGTQDNSEDFVVRNMDAYERFLRKRMLNTRATSTAGLFVLQNAS